MCVDKNSRIPPIKTAPDNCLISDLKNPQVSSNASICGPICTASSCAAAVGAKYLPLRTNSGLFKQCSNCLICCETSRLS